jgi:hypothetical protein
MSLSVAYDDDEFELELESNTLSEGWPAPAAPLSKRASSVSVLEALPEPIADVPVEHSSINDTRSSSSSGNSCDKLESAMSPDTTLPARALSEQLAPDLPEMKAAALESCVEDAVVRVLMGEAIDWAEHQRTKAQYEQLQQQKLSAQTRLCALPNSIGQHGKNANRQTYASTAALSAYQPGMLESLTSLKCHDVVMPLRDVAARQHAVQSTKAEHRSRPTSSNHVAESVA